MKTPTFSDDQASAVRDALIARIEHLEAVLSACSEIEEVYFRDKLEVTRQALDAVERAG